MRLHVYLLALPLFAGCQYLPRTEYFTAPQNEPNPAFIRIINFTQHASIYQYSNGVRSGGVVRTGPLPFIHTQDIGMPKAGQDLTFDFYETAVHPGKETEVHMSWEGEKTRYCFVTAKFTPQPGRYYQFRMTSGDEGSCKLFPTTVEQSADGAWTLKPTPDVTYPHGGPERKASYGNDLYRDPNYKPFVPPT